MLLWEMGVRFDKKTSLYTFREAVVEFVFKKLKLIYKEWEQGSALGLKCQPWWILIPGLLQLNYFVTSI